MCSIRAEDFPPGHTPTAFPLQLPPKKSPASDPADPSLLHTASDRSRRDKDRMVWVDVAKLDAAWSADESYYLSPGGSGPSAIRGRYAEARRFIGRARAESIPVEMSQVYVGEDGSVLFEDGRHRFAVLRDSGLKRLPVAVPPDAAGRLADRFGVAAPAGR